MSDDKTFLHISNDVELNESVPSSFYEQFDMLNDDLYRLNLRLFNALNRITK